MNKGRMRCTVSRRESGASASDFDADKPASPVSWRGCCGRGAGALQMAAGRQRFVATGFGGTLERPDFILIAPEDDPVGVFLTLGFVRLLQVIGVAFEDHASLFCV